MCEQYNTTCRKFSGRAVCGSNTNTSQEALCPLVTSFPRGPKVMLHPAAIPTTMTVLHTRTQQFTLLWARALPSELKKQWRNQTPNSELLCFGIVCFLSAWGSVTISFSYLQKARVWGRLSISSGTINKQLADTPVNFGNLLAIKVDWHNKLF